MMNCLSSSIMTNLTLLHFNARPYPASPITTSQVLAKERSHGLSSSKGQLNLFGSTDFVHQFTAHWQREGYCDYTAPPQSVTLSGTHVSLRCCVF